MPGLSRRSFLGLAAALSASYALPRSTLGQLLAEPALANPDAPSTLRETIRYGAVQSGDYRVLRTGPGEEYYPRLDLLGRTADPARGSRRRSLAYLGHLSDIHVMDAQSPARIEPMIAQDHSLWGGAFRPQDTLTTHVAAAMVRSVADVRYSPVTGAPLGAAFVTGDSSDMLSHLETRWYIDLLDGVPITPNSGTAGTYDGVQAWEEAYYAYHPDDPSGDWFGAYGFPAVPGMLEAAVSQEVDSGGLPVPWFTVYGNHDTLYFGTFGVSAALKDLAIGGRKYWDWQALSADFLQGWSADSTPIGRAIQSATTGLGLHRGMRSVPADPNRKLLEQRDFMHAHFETTPRPGPIGHGFTQANLDTGRTYWTADVGPFVRAFGLDTCSQIAGPDGAVPEEQFEWLRAGLAQAATDQRLAIILSHHNSLTLENGAELPLRPQRLIHADELIAMLLEHPNAIAWINGHTHINTITPHRRTDGSGGLWEITTASCIDFPQQQQVIEIVDNRDGTLSIFTTALDHASPAEWTGALDQTGLASLSRQLSANDWVETPVIRLGSELDRNAELLLPTPFDLRGITDAKIEEAQVADRARILAWEAGWPA
jgi:metallophosphoesterase (TIGR03767 family)